MRRVETEEMKKGTQDGEFKWIPPGIRADGCQERIDLITGMAQTVELETGVIRNYMLVCPKCGKVINREEQSRSWSWRVYAIEKYVHRCRIKGEMHLADIITFDMVVPPDMTIDDFYKCVRYGLLHKEEAVGTELPAAPEDEQVEGQITLDEFYGELFRKEGRTE